MSDQFDLQVNLEYTSTDAQAVLENLTNTQKALEEQMATADRNSEAFKKLQAQWEEAAKKQAALTTEINKANEEAAQSGQTIESQASSFGNLIEVLEKAGRAYQDFRKNAAAANSEIAGLTPEQLSSPAGLTDSQLSAAIELYDADQVSFVRALREEEARRKDVIRQTEQAVRSAATAQEEYESTLSGIGWDRAVSELSEVEQATWRYEEALDALAIASREVAEAEEAGGASGEQIRARTAALQESEQARIAMTDRIVASEDAQAQATDDSKQRQIDANERLKAAQKELNYADQVSDLNKVERAEEMLARRREEHAKAIQNLERAQANANNAAEGDEDASRQVTQATNELAQAKENLTQATNQASTAAEGHQSAMLNMRYGLYDVSRTMAVVSGTMIAAGTAATMAFSNWESGMSSVTQTNIDKPVSELEALEGQLKDLAGQIPVTTEELQGLATLAGQLEVQGDIGTFVDTMAQLGTLSDTLNAEEAAEQIAKLVNTMGGAEHVGAVSGVDDAYRAFATSLSQVGVTTAATDAEIMHTASNLGLVASQAGWAGDEVLGLSAATASFGIPAERARSAMQDFVSVVNQGLGGVGVERLQEMANVMGITVDEIESMWASDPMGFFQQFLSSLNAAEAGGRNYTELLASMGIEGKRAIPVLSTMASNVDMVGGALQQAAIGWGEYDDEMSIFNQRMAEVTDDLASMWQILKNEVFLALESIGTALAPALKDIVQSAGEMLVTFREWAESDIGQSFINVAVKIGTVVTVLALLAGGLAAAGAATIALRAAFSISWVQRFSLALLGVSARTQTVASRLTGAARRVYIFRNALAAAGRATGILILLDVLIRLLFDTQNTLGAVANGVFWVARVWINAFEAMGYAPASLVNTMGPIMQGAVQYVENAARMIIRAWNAVLSVFGAAPVAEPDFSGAIAGIERFQAAANNMNWDHARWGLDVLEDRINEWAGRGKYADPLREALDSDIGNWDIFNDIEEAGYEAGDNAGDGLGKGLKNGAKKGAEDAKKELRLLTDYASDLQGVFSRAFDLRFGVSLSQDDIASAFHDMRDAISDAEKKVRDIRQAIRDLRADLRQTAASISQTEYFLSVAIEYGDTLRAQQLEAELAKLQAERAKQQDELKDKTKDLAEAEDEASRSLTGNSKAAIENRRSMSDLVSAYASHLEVLAASGMSQSDLAREAKRLKQEFISQALAMGYSEKEVMKYAAAFDDMAVIIAHIPRNVTIEFDGNPALTAIREFVAQANEELANLNTGGGGPSAPTGGGPSAPTGGGPSGPVMPQSIGQLLGEGLKKAGRAADKESNRLGRLIGSNLKKGMTDETEDAMDEIIRRRRDDLSKLAEYEAITNPRGLETHPRGVPLMTLPNLLPDIIRQALQGGTEFSKTFGNTINTQIPPEVTKLGLSVPPVFRKSGSDSSAGFNQEMNHGMATLTGQMLTKGRDGGIEFRKGIVATGGPTGTELTNRVVSALNNARTRVNQAGRNNGASFKSGVQATMVSGLQSNAANRTYTALNAARNRANQAGRNVGVRFAAGVRATLATSLAANARSAGTIAGNAMLAAMRVAIRGKSIGQIAGASIKAGTPIRMANMYTGGFTGTGGKYEPAPVQAHRGEYILPQSMVNQRTGLPNANALGLIHQGVRTSGGGGGVGGRSRGMMVVELSAADRRAIASKAPVVVNVGEERVARANDAASLSRAKRGTR